VARVVPIDVRVEMPSLTNPAATFVVYPFIETSGGIAVTSGFAT
jgi:hypothetical protein